MPRIANSSDDPAPIRIRSKKRRLTRGDRTTAFAALIASARFRAPATVTSIIFVAPSPSRAIIFAKLNAHKVQRVFEIINVNVIRALAGSYQENRIVGARIAIDDDHVEAQIGCFFQARL